MDKNINNENPDAGGAPSTPETLAETLTSGNQIDSLQQFLMQSGLDNVIWTDSDRSGVTGARNIILGTEAALNLTSGGNNTTLGYQAGQSISSQSGNTCIGLQSNSTGSSGTAIGNNASCSSSSVAVGVNASCASSSIAIGASSNAAEVNTIAIGRSATAGTSINSIAIGYLADTGNSSTSSIVIGTAAGNATMSGSYNVLIGNRAGEDMTTGTTNVAMGRRSLQDITTGSNNVGIGYISGTSIISGSSNTCVGVTANVGNAAAVNRTAIGFGSTASFGNNMIRLGNTSISRFECQVALSVTSDARQKEDIEDCDIGLDLITNLKPKKFDFIGDKPDKLTKRYGFIAQEVQETVDQLGKHDFGAVAYNEHDDVYTMTYEELFAPIVQSIQELKKHIDKKQDIIDSLRARVDELEQVI